MPKSILRVSSPVGDKPPRPLVSLDTAEPTSLALPLSPKAGTDSPPGSPPASPVVPRPMSPGATVRFAKATIHRVEVGPGRRFLPVKRKSKSTLSYIAPLDPGAQKSPPKTLFHNATKMRRHQENQAAMGRYWLRTEEEEAQWRAELERRAQEEAERYRNEPASAPQPTAVSKEAAGVGELVQASPVDTAPAVGVQARRSALANVEEEAVESDSEDSDEEAGAGCGLDQVANVVMKVPAGGKPAEQPKAKTTERPRPAVTPVETAPTKTGATSSIAEQAVPASHKPQPTVATPAPQKPAAAQPPVATVVSQPATAAPAQQDTKLPETKSFSEHLAEKKASEAGATRTPPPALVSPALKTQPSPAVQPTLAKRPSKRSSSGSLSKAKSASSTSRSSSPSAGSTSGRSNRGSTEHLTKASSRDKIRDRSKDREKEKDKERDKEKDKEKEKEKEKSSKKTRPFINLRPTTPTRSPTRSSTRSPSRTSTTTTTGGSSSSSGRADRTSSPPSSPRAANSSSGSGNHLHLSGGRRGRRFFEEHKGHKQGVTA